MAARYGKRRGSRRTTSPPSRVQRWYNGRQRGYLGVLISLFAVAMGTVVTLCCSAFAGRLAACSVTALWSAATAYFVMAPIYSFRVSSPRDVVALALYGTVGLVLARRAPVRRTPIERVVPTVAPPPPVIVDLQRVIGEVALSSELGERLTKRGIEVASSSCLQRFPCSYADAVRMVSHVLALVLIEPQLRRVSFHAGRRPEERLLFVDAHRVWPPPPLRSITLGKRDEGCSRADFPSWPAHLTATWFDNGDARIYQIALRRERRAVITTQAEKTREDQIWTF